MEKDWDERQKNPELEHKRSSKFIEMFYKYELEDDLHTTTGLKYCIRILEPFTVLPSNPSDARSRPWYQLSIPRQEPKLSLQ